MAMETSYTRLRDNLATVLDQVSEDRQVVIIRRRGAPDVALIPADELSGLMETAHLLRSPANAKRLLTAQRRSVRRKGKPSTSCGGRWALGQRSEREGVFQAEFREDLRWWAETNRNAALRVLLLIEAVLEDPYKGIGIREALKHQLAGVWSRRITQEHRLVYKVTGNRVDVLQARCH
jgi:toxin YoeB